MLQRIEINPEPDGTYTFDTSKVVYICRDRENVAEWLGSMLWPVLEPAFKNKKRVKIKIKYDE